MNSIIPCKADCSWPACPQSCSGRPGHQPAQPHLILHKVRGAPAFDIAEPFITEDGEEMWVVSTSGHRAYPWWTIDIDELLAGPAYDPYTVVKSAMGVGPDLNAWPDHFPCNDRSTLATAALSLLQSIGLGPKAIKRRKVE